MSTTRTAETITDAEIRLMRKEKPAPEQSVHAETFKIALRDGRMILTAG